MSDYSQHIYQEMIKSMGNSSHTVLRDTLLRQEEATVSWLDSCINQGGLETASQLAMELISFNQNYDGVRPDIYEVAQSIAEMREEGIQHDSSQFAAHVATIGEEGLIGMSVPDGQGGYTRRENPDYKDVPVTSTSLEQSLRVQAEKLHDAKLMEDEHGIQSAENTIARIQQAMGKTETPEPAPEVGVSARETVEAVREIFSEQETQ